MKIASSKIQQYTLPLVKPLTTGKHHAFRQGLVLTLNSDTGIQGFGEIAPLPGLHKESLADASKQLLEYQFHLSGTGIRLTCEMMSFKGNLFQDLPADLLPTVRSGIEMAILDLVLQAAPDACEQFTPSIPVNALLMAGRKPIAEQVRELLQQGYSSIKIKVARQSVEKDIEDIAAVQAIARNKALLRLDANRQWTLQQAEQFCKSIDLRGIEYIEEPTQDSADHVRLIQSIPVPIALDETLAEKTCGQLDQACYRAVVLKPSLLGGFERTAQITRWAQEYRIKPVISSAFQTSLANRMYLIFAAINGITQTPLGLDTGKYFHEDLLENPLVVEKGEISLNQLAVRPRLRQDILEPPKDQC